MEGYYQRWVKKDRGLFYLVVVGDSDPDFRDMLHVWFEEANGRFFSWPPSHLIERTTPTTSPTAAKRSGTTSPAGLTPHQGDAL